MVSNACSHERDGFFQPTSIHFGLVPPVEMQHNHLTGIQANTKHNIKPTPKLMTRLT